MVVADNDQTTMARVIMTTTAEAVVAATEEVN